MDLRQSLIPTVLDESARGDRAYDIFSLLLRERIVFLGQEVDDHIANLIIAEILHLEARDPDKEIQLYINSPGGVAYAGMAIYDVMQHVRPPVSTICVGMGMSAAAMISVRRARRALPSAKIMIQSGPAGTHGRAERHGDTAERCLHLTKRTAQTTAPPLEPVTGKQVGSAISTAATSWPHRRRPESTESSTRCHAAGASPLSSWSRCRPPAKADVPGSPLVARPGNPDTFPRPGTLSPDTTVTAGRADHSLS
jgi:ATP-dependent Clp protease protease subunit